MRYSERELNPRPLLLRRRDADAAHAQLNQSGLEHHILKSSKSFIGMHALLFMLGTYYDGNLAQNYNTD